MSLKAYLVLARVFVNANIADFIDNDELAEVRVVFYL